MIIKILFLKIEILKLERSQRGEIKNLVILLFSGE